MSPPTDAQLNRIVALARDFAQLAGRSCREVAVALLSTRTLKRLGYRGNGRIETKEQADACIQILETWIRKKEHEH